MWIRRWIALLILSSILLGCGESIPTGYPVEGQVIYRKKPLAEAVVTFHPKSGGRQMTTSTDAEGRFRLTVTTPDSGLPPGDYAVSIVLFQKRRDGDEEVRNG
jgi:hypothetical protein